MGMVNCDAKKNMSDGSQNQLTSVTIHAGTDREHCREIMITRNSSLSISQIKLIVGFFAIVLGVIGAFFYSQGAWLVLPFAGLELLAVSAAFYCCIRHKNDFEMVKIDKNRIQVKRQVASREQVYEFQTHWTKVFLEITKGWYPSRLWVASKGQHVEVGQWLTDPERKQLATRLKHLIEY